MVTLGGPWVDEASVESVADAIGTSSEESCQIWHEWAIRQRDSVICGRRGVSLDEYAAVKRIFTAAHIELPDTGAAK